MIPHRVRADNLRPRGSREGAEVVESRTLLTTEPNKLVRSVGHHRMPVLLASEAEWRLWLDRGAVGRGAVDHLFAPTDAAKMTLRPAT